jgi:4-diphosphocytidyl-2-C-methyl-D-erythritol kinase
VNQAAQESREQTGSRSAEERAVRVLAPAKINLFLHVGDKRADNYHALESLVVFAEIGDRIEFAPADDVALKLTGPFAAQTPKGEDNLVLKAARALQAVANQLPGVAITMEKNLPVAAGIGGGSADAAAVLRGLNLFWQLNRPEAELLEIAAALGSDVPACFLSRPCWMEGRGEHVARTPALPSVAAILVNPGVQLSTKDVFGALNARTGAGAMRPPPSTIQTLWDVVAYLDDAGNDLEAPACQLRPVIDEVLDALNEEPGCALSQMSGSGATCFGLFDGKQFALGAAERIAQEHPHWWVRATRIAAPDIGTPHWKGE